MVTLVQPRIMIPWFFGSVWPTWFTGSRRPSPRYVQVTLPSPINDPVVVGPPDAADVPATTQRYVRSWGLPSGSPVGFVTLSPTLYAWLPCQLGNTSVTPTTAPQLPSTPRLVIVILSSPFARKIATCAFGML